MTTRLWKPDSGQGLRPTLGLVTHGAGDPNSHVVWSGVASVAQERNVNLICFPGKPLRSQMGFEAQSNVLYDLMSLEKLDGLVIWLAGIATWVGADELRTFCRRYQPLPIVTLGGVVEGVPGVTVDNYHGMRNVISHLVETHRYRRIAFVRGPEIHQEAEERYHAYTDVLAEAGLPFDPQLVVMGNFKESGGTRAINVLLDERHTTFDALAAASDNMAIAAAKALQARGIRVPGDIAVAGLNDESQGRVMMPPLTTGPLRFYEQARQAAEMVLELMAGHPVSEHVILPTRLLIRQSCGCPDPIIEAASASNGETASGGLETAFPVIGPATLAEMTQAAEVAPDHPDADLLAQLVQSFIESVSGEPHLSFLSVLEELLRHSAAAGESLSKWHGVISALRRQFRPYVSQPEQRLQRAENLWQQARALIGETALRVQAYETLQAELKVRILGEINPALSAAVEVDQLADVLAEALPKLNIAAFYLSLYEKPEAPAEWSRLVAAEKVARLQAFSGQRFASCDLVPAGVLPADRRYSLVVEPLYFREDQFGFVVFEANPLEEEVYEILRGEISGALQRTRLIARNVELYNEALKARQVAEDGRRSAEEADRLKSRFLATVSHELRTPLSLIVGTVEMMQMENARGGVPLAAFEQDMGYIRASAQHLARLIGDVLDLTSSQAGELRLVGESLNLAEALQEALVLSESLARAKGLTWHAEIREPLPLVWGDRARLRQVVLNLVSNAVKFTEQGGAVTLTVRGGERSVMVEVRDTGMGIPASEQALIFDEFRQSERTAKRGYGGIGLGLAISRGLVELHGGKLDVYSSGEEGGGSTFFFTLPVFGGLATTMKKAVDRSHTVLLLTARQGGDGRLPAYLAQREFEVQTLAIEETPDWLSQVVAAPPGAVVLDFQPAAEAGWELMSLLKENPATQDIPVVFYSLAEGQECGSVLELDYLAKPLGSMQLARALERQGVGRDTCEEGRTILVVDDEPNLLDVHSRLVQAHVPRCRVLKASNGREALDLMEREPPQLVLLDLMMPVLDGFAVLEAMREKELTRDVPVIVLTARFLTRQDMARLQHGVAAVLGKELFTAAEVLTLVEATLTRNKRLSFKVQGVVRQAMAFIHEHYAEPLTRSAVARHVAITERYLTRCFREEVGLTPMTYLNRYRVKQAKKLLEAGGHTITEVALAVGFSESAYFSRVFRQEAGVAPRAYQQGKRERERADG